jgi:phosphatidylglycerophosphatase A
VRGGRAGLPAWHPAWLLATGFGIGLLPLAPGSWASLAALPAAWLLRGRFGVAGLAAAAAALFLLGWWAAARVAAASVEKDPGFVVVDEIVAQWLVLLAVPLDPVAYVLAFGLFRAFDIWKPWPVSVADRRIGGGLGIMLDDVLAALYAILVLATLASIGGMPGVRR